MKKLLTLATILLFPSLGAAQEKIHFRTETTIDSIGRLTFSRLPNETTVCIYGVMVENNLYVTGFEEARIIAASDSGTRFQCPDHSVGIAHSHVKPVIRCEHSYPDAQLLGRWLFSIVFCADGTAEIHVWDTRHHELVWKREQQ